MNSKKPTDAAVIIDAGDMTEEEAIKAAGVDPESVTSVVPVVFTAESKIALAAMLQTVYKLVVSTEADQLSLTPAATEEDKAVARMVGLAVAALPWALNMKLGPQISDFELGTAWQLAIMLADDFNRHLPPQDKLKIN